MKLERLIKESVSGNTVAFRALFEALDEPIFRFLRAGVGTREDALDLMQETFLDLWQALRDGKFVYVSEPGFYGFLYQIARRKVARFYRTKHATVSLEDLTDSLVVSTSESSPGEWSLVLRSLEGLDTEDRTVIQLHYFSGLTFSEIAQLLDKEEGTVRVRHHRALARLKKTLGYEKEQ